MILTFIEIREGKIKKSSLEALREAKTAGRRAGTYPSAAVLVGPAVECFAIRGFRLRRGARSSSREPGLAHYSAQGYARALATSSEETPPRPSFSPRHGHGPGPGAAARGQARGRAGLRLHDGRRQGRPARVHPADLRRQGLSDGLGLRSTPADRDARPNVFPSTRTQARPARSSRRRSRFRTARSRAGGRDLSGKAEPRSTSPKPRSSSPAAGG